MDIKKLGYTVKKYNIHSLSSTSKVDYLPDKFTALRLLGSFHRVILKAEWSPNILSRGCENFFPLLTSLQNNKTIQ